MSSQASFWGKRAQKYNAELEQHDKFFLANIARFKSNLSQEDNVLDFASASGEYAIHLAPHVKQIHAIDTSEKMIELAKTKAENLQLANIKVSNTDVLDADLDSDAEY